MRMVIVFAALKRKLDRIRATGGKEAGLSAVAFDLRFRTSELDSQIKRLSRTCFISSVAVAEVLTSIGQAQTLHEKT